MSGKSKKTTADRTICAQKQIKYISQSANKIVNRLSLSFYAEDTLRKRKQIILDIYDDFDSQSPIFSQPQKPASLSRGKIAKSSTPIVRIKPQYISSSSKQPKIAQRVIKNTNSQKQSKNSKLLDTTEKRHLKSRERSSSKSSRGKNPNSMLFNYIANRMDGTGKGWNILKAPAKSVLQKRV